MSTNQTPSSDKNTKTQPRRSGGGAKGGAMAKAVTHKIMSLCLGNGFKKGEIKLARIDGRVLPMIARTVITPTVSAQSRTEKGRQKGDKTFSSREEMQKDLDNLSQNLADNTKMIGKIVDQVKKRKDRGIGIVGEAINLKTLDQSYVAHVACEVCHQKGLSPCPKCNGAKHMQCIRCHGDTMVQCVVCSGSGSIAGPDGAQKPCPRCKGETRVACDYCQGNGKTPCDRCSGQGQTTCQNCKGAGVNSEIASVQMQASIDGAFVIKDLPDDNDKAKAKAIAAIGPQLVSDKLAKIKGLKTGMTKDKRPVLNYQMQLPYAAFKLTSGATQYDGLMIGYNPRFLELPELLTPKLAPVVAFAKSDKAELSPVKALQRIGQFKIFREAMAMTAKTSVNAATENLRKKYLPLINPGLAEDIALQTNILLNKATQAPKKIATAWVSVMMVVLFAGYFIGPGHDMIQKTLTANPALADFAHMASWVVLALALGLTGPLHKIMARSHFQRKIGRLLPGNYADLLLSRLQRFQITPYAMTILIFSVFYIGIDVLDLASDIAL